MIVNFDTIRYRHTSSCVSKYCLSAIFKANYYSCDKRSVVINSCLIQRREGSKRIKKYYIKYCLEYKGII